MFMTDAEAIHHILQENRRYVCYLGAGASAEAGVFTAQTICQDIRNKLLNIAPIKDPKSGKEVEQWANAALDWQDPSRRYSACVRKGYRNQAERVQYFRGLLAHKQPAFCHYAVSLLMSHRYLKGTCLTTNFDKLLENAFAQQRQAECQPIRTDEESRYWQPEEDRYHIVKLHGDYDTHNIMNTNDETVEISGAMLGIARMLLQSSALVVLGTAGYEKSIHTMFDKLASGATDVNKVLSFGLLWGVYMGQPKPKFLTPAESEKLVQKRIGAGEVGNDIYEMIRRTNQRNSLFCFFPVWGAGAFLFDLIKATRDETLIGTAELYLDHEIRLRHVFTQVGLPEGAISKHITALRNRKQALSPKPGGEYRKTDLAFRALNPKTGIEIRLVYGDIASRASLAAPEFQRLVRAVISAEDTCLSAGGGVAYELLNRAGKYTILNELAKFGPLEQGKVAVTSGGELPVHYIFHAAAIEIKKNADYSVSGNSVRRTMAAALEKALALDVGALWVPLMGTGLASLQAEQSLQAILDAVCEWDNNKHRLVITVVVYREKDLSRDAARKYLERKLKAPFKIDAL